MSLLGRALRPRNEGAIGSSRELWEHLARGYTAESGVEVTEHTAMKLAAFFACMRVLGETMASAPCIVYERLKGEDKERRPEHWAYELLHDEPNAFQTPAEFFEMLTVASMVGGCGNAMMSVVRGEVRELLPVPPSRVRNILSPATGRLHHDVTLPDGQVIQVPAERMFRLPFMSLDGVNGISLLSYQRETLGLGLGMNRHGAKLFKQGAMVGGVIESPEVLGDDAYERLKESFDEQYAGLENANKTVILEEGAKFNRTGLSNTDLQFLESMKFNWDQVCGICRVPPHLTMKLDRSTFNNIESLDLGFLKYTMLPWFRRWEQRILKHIIPRQDRRTLLAEFLLSGLLRADSAGRATYYRTAVMTGWMTRNEVRVADSMNRGPEELDEFLTPLNMAVGGEPLDDLQRKDRGNDAAA